MSIIHLIIDGGPCAGKTILMEHIRLWCEERGIECIFVAESARAYFKQHGHNNEMWVQQTGIYQLQIDFEIPIREKAEELRKNGSRVLVCYDRSRMTSKAYMPLEEWHKLLEYFGTSEKEIASLYTHRFHIVTAADGAPEHYTNDPERPESPEEAIIRDLRLQKMWDGHFDNIPIIRNRGGMPEKINDLKLEFLNIIENHV